MSTTSREFRESLCCCLLIVSVVLTGPALAADVTSQVSITGMTQVSSTRVGRTLYEYTYRVSFVNSGRALTGVMAKVTSNTTSTQIIDGAVEVGILEESSSSTPTDTITIRQDRTAPFNPAMLQWSVSGLSAAQLGVFLPGAPGDPAIAATYNFDTGEVFVDKGVYEAADGSRYAHGGLEMDLASNATVGGVNALLARIRGRISLMGQNDTTLVVQILDPGSLDGLQNVLTQVLSDSNVQGGGLLLVPGLRELFDGFSSPLSGDVVSALDNQLAVRADAALNARNVIKGDKPVLIMYDSFGFGPPSHAFKVNVLQDGDFDFPSTPSNNDRHGYAVLSVISAVGSPENSVPFGIYPDSIDLRVLNGLTPWGTSLPRLAKLIREERNKGKRVVVNTSVGYVPAQFSCTVTCERYARRWREVLAGENLGSADFIHLTAGGNDGEADDTSSPFSRTFVPPYPPLDNTLVVANRTNIMSSDSLSRRPVPGPLSNLFSPNGENCVSNVFSLFSAIGTNVKAWASPTGDIVTLGSGACGASFSTPQVAGAALYLWSARPDLDAIRIKEIITTTAEETPDGGKVLDVYVALLGADDNLTATGAPVRTAILDVVGSQAGETSDPLPIIGNGKFDHADLLRFVREFVERNGAEDFSRFDLNGDGRTGDSRARLISGFQGIPSGYSGIPFDLNANHIISSGSPPEYETYLWENNVFNVALNVDEGYLSDWDILCFYAFSGLYQGETDPNRTDKRLLILLPHLPKCGMGLDRLVLTIRDVSSTWVTSPPAELYNFGAESLFFNGSSASSDCSFGERGSPVWSSNPRSVFATFRSVTDILNGAYPVGSPPNRRGCSSFVAYTDGKVWINATVRRWTINQFGNIADREYQSRYYGGDPNNDWANSSLTIGRVVNEFAGFAAEVFPQDYSLSVQISPLP